MAIEIVMPALEMVQETALLLRWSKSEGEYVSKGEVLMEIETDKATVEIEATGSGILSRVTAHAGDQVPVGKVIAVLLDEKSPSSSSETRSAPLDSTTANQSSGANVRSEKPNALPRSSSSPTARPISPKARRLAKDHGLDLATLQASSTGQVVHASDIAKMLDSTVGNAPPGEYVALPLKGKRKVIAERTQKSYQTAPHISLTLSIDMSEAQKLIQFTRVAARDDGAASPNLTSVLLKAAVEALAKHPRLNAHLVNDEVQEYRGIHLGVAVAVEDGLLVPVIRNAGLKSAVEIQSELTDLAVRGRAGRLRIDEMTGSTFTVSNLGMFGIEHFSAILNPPEVGILSLGCIADKAINNRGSAEFHPYLEATINVDHRAIDGAGAAAYLRTLKELLEHPQFIY